MLLRIARRKKDSDVLKIVSSISFDTCDLETFHYIVNRITYIEIKETFS